ncbi:hypothetical protein [Burkholderia ubonensis]|uniref:hypothetical protein n=1 Tax=Burkholderia ubonensis TaxID=101571 RepID=UPI0018DF98D7|nr:hypothetical protein [Burkholderia ubonensis]
MKPTLTGATMKLKREARTLKSKALASLRRAMEVFNGYDESGRVDSVLLHLQHCSEMLTKSLLFQKGHSIFDAKAGISIGLEAVLRIALNEKYVTADQAGAIRAVDSMRDAAQHWMIVVSEDVLYLHARALVTVVDDILQGHFDDTLADNLPMRVLPISTHPIGEVQLLIDREYRQIRELLAPGKRARDEARGRIRTLLALEGHVADSVGLSERDIDRIERAVRAGDELAAVFPRLMTLSADVAGEGITVRVRFGKNANLPAVRYVEADDPGAAAAIREVDLQRKYHLSAQDLAAKLNLTPPKAKALRDFIGGADGGDYVYCFQFGSQKILRYSDNALKALQAANTPENVGAAWAQRKR